MACASFRRHWRPPRMYPCRTSSLWKCSGTSSRTEGTRSPKSTTASPKTAAATSASRCAQPTAAMRTPWACATAITGASPWGSALCGRYDRGRHPAGALHHPRALRQESRHHPCLTCGTSLRSTRSYRTAEVNATSVGVVGLGLDQRSLHTRMASSIAAWTLRAAQASPIR